MQTGEVKSHNKQTGLGVINWRGRSIAFFDVDTSHDPGDKVAFVLLSTMFGYAARYVEKVVNVKV